MLPSPYDTLYWQGKFGVHPGMSPPYNEEQKFWSQDTYFAVLDPLGSNNASSTCKAPKSTLLINTQNNHPTEKNSTARDHQTKLNKDYPLYITFLRATLACHTIHPKDVTSGVHLHIIVLGWRSKRNLSKIKPTNNPIRK